MIISLKSKLSDDIKSLYEEPRDADVTIQVGEGSVSKIFRAHRLILCARSLYFSRELSYDNEDTSIEKSSFGMIIEQIQPSTFEILLEYIYTGTIDMNDDFNLYLATIDAAYYLELNYLAEEIQVCLTKKENLMRRHIVRASREASSRENLKILDEFCKEFIENSPEVIFAAEDFQDIDEATLVKLLKRDIDLSEDVIWEQVLLWGTSKRPDLRLDAVKTWSVADFDYMRKVLKDCIPLIRFFHINENAYLEKVLPFLPLLPYQLWMDLVTFKQTFGQYKPISTVLPPRNRKVSSSPDLSEESSRDRTCHLSPDIKVQYDEEIEEIEEMEEIIHYDGLVSSILTPKQKQWLMQQVALRFRRLYAIGGAIRIKATRLYIGSVYDYRPKKFHKYCDEQGPTLSVLSIKGENDEIIGGYNSSDWNKSGAFARAPESFIFALRDNGNIISCCNDINRAIYNNACFGPSFGTSDLILQHKFSLKNCSAKQSSYSKPIRESEEAFAVEEIEVFKISI
ncbi:3440_t:CDS:2 [Paraglomus occultum]|uniref:3440_t:CDS:1 n=1 Tax=Paraglomus occultum TaxID=144539 RepID=A0A9N9BWR7_9GLOM|nr:3440_t:CDS:2 [Paraglomus occultum]